MSKLKITVFLFIILFISCREEVKKQNILIGTWRLQSGTLIEKGDTTVVDYTKDISFIKIINETHFAFLQHDQMFGRDSSAVFVAGGGSYSLMGNVYKERLEYCSAREWEGNEFTFEIDVHQDTLIQRGLEKIDSLNIERLNIEVYVKERPGK